MGPAEYVEAPSKDLISYPPHPLEKASVKRLNMASLIYAKKKKRAMNLRTGCSMRGDKSRCCPLEVLFLLHERRMVNLPRAK